MKYSVCIIWLMCIYGYSIAQISKEFSTFAGNTSHNTAQSSIWSIVSVPAAYTPDTTLSAGIHIANPYTLDNIFVGTLCVGTHTDFGNIASSYTHLTSEYSNYGDVAIHVSKELISQFYMALSFHYEYAHSAFSTINTMNLAPQVSVLYYPYKEISLASSITHYFSKHNSHKSSNIFLLGASYHGLTNTTFSTTIQNYTDTDFETSFGIDYRITKEFQLAGKISTKHNPLALGFSFIQKKFQLQVESSLHSFLGMSYSTCFLLFI